ncbi:hypothetical protein K443DRAFT_634086, partial [Laccaria amethystina LaAM-08-1]
MHIKKQANSPPETRQATVSVTRRVHIKTRPTHLLKPDRPQSVSPEECTLKTRPTHLLKQDKPQSVSPEQCTLKNRPTHKLKQDRP